MVDAVLAEVRARGLDRVGVVGTRFTMQADFYPRVFTAGGVTIDVPDEAEQAWIHDKYVNELLRDRFLPETRAALLEIIGRLAARTSARAVLLAGTELPLLLTAPAHGDVALLDTAAIHVDHAIARVGAD